MIFLPVTWNALLLLLVHFIQVEGHKILNTKNESVGAHTNTLILPIKSSKIYHNASSNSSFINESETKASGEIKPVVSSSENNTSTGQNSSEENAFNVSEAAQALKNLSNNSDDDGLYNSLPTLIGYVNSYASKLKARYSSSSEKGEGAGNISKEIPQIKINDNGKLQYVISRAAGYKAEEKERPKSFLGRNKYDSPPRDTEKVTANSTFQRHLIFSIIVIFILSLGVFAWLKIGLEDNNNQNAGIFKKDVPKRRNKQPLNFTKAE